MNTNYTFMKITPWNVMNLHLNLNPKKHGHKNVPKIFVDHECVLKNCETCVFESIIETYFKRHNHNKHMGQIF